MTRPTLLCLALLALAACGGSDVTGPAGDTPHLYRLTSTYAAETPVVNDTAQLSLELDYSTSADTTWRPVANATLTTDWAAPHVSPLVTNAQGIATGTWSLYPTTGTVHLTVTYTPPVGMGASVVVYATGP